MIMKRYIFVWILLVLTCACSNKEQQLKEKLTQTITQYAQSNIQGLHVDSVNIHGIDTLTDMDFAYMSKVILQNKQSELESHYLMYSEPETAEERIEQYELNRKLDEIKNNVIYWDSVLLDNNTDTSSLRYYFVSVSIFGQVGHLGSQKYDIGFPITTDFKVKEIHLYND